MTRKITNVIQTAKKDSTFSVVKVIITALTAVTVSIISSKLTSQLNSLIIVVIASVSTALVSEFYRVVLTITRETTVMALKPVIEHIDAATPETIEIKLDTNNEAEEEPISPISTVKRFFKKRTLTSLTLVFLFFSLLTIFVSYKISEITDGEDITHNQYIINNIEELNDDVRAEIINEFSSQFDLKIGELLTPINDSIKDLEMRLSILQNDLEAKDESTITDDNMITIEELEKELEAIKNRINDLDNKTVVTESPSVSPTVPEPPITEPTEPTQPEEPEEPTQQEEPETSTMIPYPLTPDSLPTPTSDD